MTKKLIMGFMALLASAPLMADPIDAEQAKALAAQFVTTSGSEPQLVKKAVRRCTDSRKLAPKYRSAAPYYIFSRGENQGFVIVSGDNALPEVLGYTESGDYDEENMAPFLKWYLESYGDMVEAAQAAKAPKMKAPLAAASRVDIAPLVQTHWNQGWPYNNLCPDRKDGGGKCLTGCVATAASQVLYYWHKDLTDVTLAATTSYTYGDAAMATKAFPKGTQIKWGLMQLQYGNEPEEFRDAVATLMAVVGGGAGLTYGSSTSGHNDNCRGVFSKIFGLNGGKENNKDWGEAYNNYSDEGWATLLYNELIQSRPILYSGCNEKGEGHAVVVDGYQEKTGYFHFNLGWGGQGDGYFTVARGKSPSWGFNSSWQECVTGVYPSTPRLSASMTLPDGCVLNHDNPVRAFIRNNGTLPYTGVYLFCSTSSKLPSALSSAKVSDQTTVVPADGSEVEIDLSFKMTVGHTFYVTLTDANLNVLARQTVVPHAVENDLAFSSIDVMASADTEMHGADSYHVVYGNRAVVAARLANKGSETFQGSPLLNVFSSEDDGETFVLEGQVRGSDTRIEPQSEGEATFSLSTSGNVKLEKDRPYYVALSNPLISNTDLHVSYAQPDTLARFVLKETDSALKATLSEQTLVFTGTWDAGQFLTLTQNAANKEAVCYDLTQVHAMGPVPSVSGKPNALILVADDSQATGVNVVIASAWTADEIALSMGADYCATADIQAKKASFTLDLEPGMWHLLTVPFSAALPDGIVAKQIDSHSSTGINNKTTLVRSVEGGKTYLVMLADSRHQLIEASDVTVCHEPQANPDEMVVGTFAATTSPSGTFALNDDEPQYFVPSSGGFAVIAFGGYLAPTNIKKQFSAHSNIVLDQAYLKLVKSIMNACAVYDRYAYAVTDDACQQMSVAIAEAEKIFAERSIEGSSEVSALVEQLNDQAAAFRLQLREGMGRVDIDMTAAIVNPSFEEGQTSSTSGSLKGWTVSGTGATVRMNSLVSYRGVGADGDYLLYCAAPSAGTPVTISQTLTSLPAGLYALSAKAGTEAGTSVTLFAGSDEVSINAHAFGKYYLNEATADSIVVLDGSELTIGIRGGDTWFKADDFRLTYLRALTAEEDPVGINQLAGADFHPQVVVTPVDGGIRITAVSPQTVVVYGLTGRKVARLAVNGSATAMLPPGIYIVAGRKVVVR